MFFRKGKYEQARELLERVIQMDRGTDSGEVWDHLGDVYARLKQTAKAKEAWENALKYFKYDRRARNKADPRQRRKRFAKSQNNSQRLYPNSLEQILSATERTQPSAEMTDIACRTRSEYSDESDFVVDSPSFNGHESRRSGILTRQKS